MTEQTAIKFNYHDVKGQKIDITGTIPVVYRVCFSKVGWKTIAGDRLMSSVGRIMAHAEELFYRLPDATVMMVCVAAINEDGSVNEMQPSGLILGLVHRPKK